MNFVCPLPPLKVLVRAEYLYDFEKGHGDLVEGIWCSVKSHRGEAFRFAHTVQMHTVLAAVQAWQDISLSLP